MCGIVGYVGDKESAPILVSGLRKLEYRGYDSAGVALNRGDSIEVVKTAGRIADLEELVSSSGDLTAVSGIGHTRWATHGAPNTVNAHPHADQTGDVIVVHNGIVENWADLKQKLIDQGHENRAPDFLALR